MEKSERTNKRMNEKMKYPKVVQTSTRRKHSLHLYAYSMYIGRLQSHKKSRAVRMANSYMKTRMLALNLHLNSSTICLWSIFDCWCSQCHRYQNGGGFCHRCCYCCWCFWCMRFLPSSSSFGCMWLVHSNSFTVSLFISTLSNKNMYKNIRSRY